MTGHRAYYQSTFFTWSFESLNPEFRNLFSIFLMINLNSSGQNIGVYVQFSYVDEFTEGPGRITEETNS